MKDADLFEKMAIFGIALDRVNREEVTIEETTEVTIELEVQEDPVAISPFKLKRTFTLD